MGKNSRLESIDDEGEELNMKQGLVNKGKEGIGM